MKKIYILSLISFFLHSSIISQNNLFEVEEEVYVESDDDLTTSNEPLFSSIDLYLSTEDNKGNNVEFYISELDKTLSFENYPLSLTMDMFTTIYFSKDQYERSVLILELDESTSSYLEQITSTYSNHYLALTYHDEVLYCPLISGTIHNGQLSIPIINNTYQEQLIHEIFNSWQHLSSPDSQPDYYYTSRSLTTGVYLIHDELEYDNYILVYDRFNDREIVIQDDAFLEVSAFDTVFISVSGENEINVHLVFNDEALTEINSFESNFNKQQFAFLIHGEYDFTFTRDEINTKKELIVPMKDPYLAESLYRSFYLWDENDQNLKTIESFYEDISTDDFPEVQKYDANVYSKAENVLMDKGVYTLIFKSSNSSHQEKGLDTLQIEMLNDSVSIVSKLDHYGERMYDIYSNMIITLADSDGNLFLTIGSAGLGLFSIEKIKNKTIATQVNDNQDKKIIEIEKITKKTKEPKLEGLWTVYEMLVNNEIQELPDEKIAFQFSKDGSLNITPSKEGKWVISPSGSLLVMYEDDDFQNKEIFKIQSISKNELVLSLSQPFSSKVIMVLKK